MRNAINWFEIPATNFDRAVAFYRTVLGRDIRTGEFMGVPHGFFPADEHGVAGAIIAPPDATPGAHGTLIYLDAAPSLGDAVARVARAGGQVLLPETSIGEQGVIAIVLDSEGNRVGLHVA
ncbi:MAG: VOC family protein [Kouleothrix sp.]|jgi:predicted enzyme related to lactoylglutathione lyase|nr:VOC family protein [Kouleothrix sp.]